MAFCIQRPETAFSQDRTGKRERRIVDEAHLAFIRKLPSVVSGKGPCEACHIRAGSPIHRKRRTPMARKPDDAWTLPLTPDEHRDQHSVNEMEFWLRHGIDPFTLALKLYAVTGDLEAGRRIIEDLER